MKKILFAFLLGAFLISSQVAFGDEMTFDVSVTPEIPIYTGRISNKTIGEDIASFDYFSYLPLEGVISEASILFELGSTNINKLSKVDLYLNDTLIFDFNSLSKSDKKALKKGGTIDFDIDLFELGLSEAELDALLLELAEGEATLSLVGKPKFFSSLLIVGDITLRIKDPVTNGDGAPVPEPTTMLLLGAGLIGLWGLRKRIKK